ncbi:MAG: LptF/LptG family permease [Weeksellaceae bacterium]|nr:LptF/LptG family permease [Weeksellaceae bacterium]
MLKKLDWYTIKTFFGPFLFIFSVLFFIFMVQFAWQEMDKFVGKGLDVWTIFKLLFYLGLSVIQLVVPLTVLLAAIMTFGGFGEKYELAAMKSTGISLPRIMLPLFLMVTILSVGLYYFQDQVVPEAQRKARNMLLNIARTKPALNFDAGVFIDGVPGFSMKIAEKSGRDGEFIRDVFIHKDVSPFDNHQTIVAKHGVFEPAEDKRFLKLALYDGYFYEDEIYQKPYNELQKQPFRTVKFDTMVQFFDISSIIEQAIERESVTDHYRFLNTRQLSNRIDTLHMRKDSMYNRIYRERMNALVYEIADVRRKAQHQLPEHVSLLQPQDSAHMQSALHQVITEMDRDIQSYGYSKGTIKGDNSFIARHVLILVRNFSNSLMCIAFFMIGAPLGAIIRKGGVGMPVIVAILIFIGFYLIYMYTEQLSKNTSIEPYTAAWMPFLVFFPLGLFFTYKAMTDSAIFDLEVYLQPFRRILSIFGIGKKAREHARYQ